MTKSEGSSQGRAVQAYRKRLREEGFARFEVLGLDKDRALIRLIARRLSADDRGSAEFRSALAGLVGDKTATRGGIYEALRRSPLVGAGLVFERERSSGRAATLATTNTKDFEAPRLRQNRPL